LAACRKILRHVKIPFQVRTKIFRKAKFHHFHRQVPPAFLIDDHAGRIARYIWWTNQESFPADIIPPGSPCSYITWGRNNRPTGDRSSEKYSHSIGTIIMIKCTITYLAQCVLRMVRTRFRVESLPTHAWFIFCTADTQISVESVALLCSFQTNALSL
jgi:hypothetical protein